MQKCGIFLKRCQTKKTLVFFLGLGLFVPVQAFALTTGGDISVTLPCKSVTECCDGTGSLIVGGSANIPKYCCETGETELRCPSGWTRSGSTCSRSATTSSDSTGSYKVTYTSCTADTIRCAAGSSTYTSNTCLQCLPNTEM